METRVGMLAGLFIGGSYAAGAASIAIAALYALGFLAARFDLLKRRPGLPRAVAAR